MNSLELGKAMAKIRTESGTSVRSLAKELNISVDWINKFERGKVKNFNIKNVELVLSYFGYELIYDMKKKKVFTKYFTEAKSYPIGSTSRKYYYYDKDVSISIGDIDLIVDKVNSLFLNKK